MNFTCLAFLFFRFDRFLQSSLKIFIDQCHQLIDRSGMIGWCAQTDEGCQAAGAGVTALPLCVAWLGNSWPPIITASFAYLRAYR